MKQAPLSAVILCAITLVSCGGTDTSSEASLAEGRQAQPIAVTTSVAVSREIPLHIDVTGTLVAEESSDVSPLTAGRVVATPVDVGAFVQAGDILARLDDRDAQLRLNQARANAEQTAASLRQAEARIGFGRGSTFDPDTVPEVQAARASYESAKAEVSLAEADARRYASLVETGDVSRSNYEKMLTQAQTATARANAAQRQYEAAANAARQNYQGVESAQSSLTAVQAQQEMAEKAVHDTIIRAPFSGFLSARPVAIGEYVSTSSVIATVVRVNPLKLQLQVPEADAGLIQSGMKVLASVAAFGARQFEGRVAALNPSVDAASRALTVEALLPNEKRELRPGMFAAAQILLPGSETAVLVPKTAVLADPNTDSAQVFVVSERTARVRVVRLGGSIDGMVRLLAGVSAGEPVATSSLQQLYDGAVLNPSEPPVEQPGAAESGESH